MDRTVCGDCGAPMELCDCKSFFRAKEVKRMRTEIERLTAEVERLSSLVDWCSKRNEVDADEIVRLSEQLKEARQRNG